MASPLTSPVIEQFRRGLNVQAVQKFRGLNSYSNLTVLGPEWAQDLMNVIVSGSGGLSKFRLPVKLSIAVTGRGPQSFWDFQQGNGLRQVIANFGTSLYYFTNDLSAVTLIETNNLNAPPWSFHAANNILFGVNGQRAMKWTGTAWQNWGIAAPLTAPGAPVVIAGNLSPVLGGYGYSYAYKNSVTGHVGNRTDVSTLTGNQANKKFQVLAIASTDAQVDTVVWFRNLDGGGDQFRLAEVNINTGAVTTFAGGADVTVTVGTGNLGITDNTPDSSLDQQTRGPLINNPPLVGRYVAVGQGRVFIFNLIGFPQDIIYSGYEQILLGRPEESFPQFNRLRLSIGAEQIAGGGVLQSGVVAFSQTGRMYMLRGAIEDITLNAPVNFSAFLEELPWTLGCASHFTIQASPYGLIWLAGDKTVQLFNGHDEPTDISPGVYPYLRRITPGTESQCVSGYFNWLERDWYSLLACVDGSLTINRLFMFAFNKTPGTNDLDSVEVFVSDLPATLPNAVPWIGVLTNSKLQRKLCISGTEAGPLVQFNDNFARPGPLGPAYVLDPTNGYVFTGTGIQQPVPGVGAAWYTLLAGSVQGRDQTVSITIPHFDIGHSNFSSGVLARVQGTPQAPTSYYTLGLSASNPQIAIYRVVNNGAPFVLASQASIAIPDNSVLELSVVGTLLTAKLNGVPILAVNDGLLTNGTSGFITTGPLLSAFSSTTQPFSAGFIYELPVSSDTVNGITRDFAMITPTAGVLSAFWRGGYFGNESPARSKLYRWSRLLADQGGFGLTFRMVDDEERTLRNPEILGPYPVQKRRNGINRRAKRAAVEINFPPNDVPANVLELQVAEIATTDR